MVVKRNPSTQLMEETLYSPLGLKTTAIKLVLRRPTVKNSNAKRAIPTATTVTRMSVTGVKRASFSWVSLTLASDKVETGLQGATRNKQLSCGIGFRVFVCWHLLSKEKF